MHRGDRRSRRGPLALAVGTTAGVLAMAGLIFLAGAYGFFAAAALLVLTVFVVRRVAGRRP